MDTSSPPSSFETLLRSGTLTKATRAANGWTQTFYEAGPKTGPLVMVLHGFPGTPAFAARMLPSLIGAGYHVVMPELRWLTPAASRRASDPDASSSPGSAHYGLDVIARDVEGLAATFSTAPMRLVTHDFGSIIAYQIDPQKIERLVTMSIPHPAGTLPTHARLDTAVKARHFATIPLHSSAAYVRDNLDAWVERWGDGFAPDLVEFKARLQEPDVAVAVRELYTQYDLNAVHNTPKQALGLSGTWQMYLATEVPTLAFAGLRDGATSLGSFDDGRKYHRGPYEVRKVDAGHFIAEELDVGPQIIGFLSSPDRTR